MTRGHRETDGDEADSENESAEPGQSTEMKYSKKLGVVKFPVKKSYLKKRTESLEESVVPPTPFALKDVEGTAGAEFQQGMKRIQAALDDVPEQFSPKRQKFQETQSGLGQLPMLTVQAVNWVREDRKERRKPRHLVGQGANSWN